MIYSNSLYVKKARPSSLNVELKRSFECGARVGSINEGTLKTQIP
jgi:hypothetical protein